MMGFENLENVETVDVYPLYVLGNLDKFLNSHGHKCVEVENGMIVYFDFKEFNEKVAVLISNLGSSFMVLAAIPIRDDKDVVNACLELFRELDSKMRLDKEYIGCYMENYNDKGVNVFRDVVLTRSEENDVANIFKAIFDICSLVISFKRTMTERIQKYIKQQSSLSDEFDKFLEDAKKINTELEENKRTAGNGCLISLMIILGYALLIGIAIAIA